MTASSEGTVRTHTPVAWVSHPAPSRPAAATPAPAAGRHSGVWLSSTTAPALRRPPAAVTNAGCHSGLAWLSSKAAGAGTGGGGALPAPAACGPACHSGVWLSTTTRRLAAAEAPASLAPAGPPRALPLRFQGGVSRGGAAPGAAWGGRKLKPPPPPSCSACCHQPCCCCGGAGSRLSSPSSCQETSEHAGSAAAAGAGKALPPQLAPLAPGGCRPPGCQP